MSNEPKAVTRGFVEALTTWAIRLTIYYGIGVVIYQMGRVGG